MAYWQCVSSHLELAISNRSDEGEPEKSSPDLFCLESFVPDMLQGIVNFS